MTTSPLPSPLRLDPKEITRKMQARRVRWKAGPNPDCMSQIRENFKAKLPRHDPTTARTPGRSTASPQARPGWEIPLQHITFALMTREASLHSHDCSSRRLQHREVASRLISRDKWVYTVHRANWTWGQKYTGVDGGMPNDTMMPKFGNHFRALAVVQHQAHCLQRHTLIDTAQLQG